MLSREDNALITQVGPTTPMGQLMREYWIPVVFSSELPHPDSDPLRVRLLGEDLIAFRDSTGAIGLLGDHCPHRGASLFFGRSEEGGLRCVYHGWKFDASGRCVDMPNEPAESDFKDRVRATAYPCAERNGVVWTYMGRRDPRPDLPLLEWNALPIDHCYVSKRVAANNWLQALEGAMDTSHVNFLHAPLPSSHQPTVGASAGQTYMMRDRSPRFDALAIDGGVLVAARRAAEPGSYYWRVNPFMMPFYTLFPATGSDPAFSGHAWVPIDDFNTLVFHFTFHPLRPLTSDELEYLRHGRDGVDGFHPKVDGFLPPTSQAFGAWQPIVRKENDYLIDYQLQRTRAFCGIKDAWAQDSAVQEGMGPVYDRSREHLGTSDVGIIAVRRYLLDAARAEIAPGATDPDVFRRRAAAVILAADANVWGSVLDITQAQPGTGFAVV